MRIINRPTYHLEGVVKAKEADLGTFDGPLDLILSLLSKNKMEIKDIQISLILEQYMTWMRGRQQMDLEVTSDFVAMASHLVYLKGRMLLSVGDEEVLSEMDLLIASLEAHQRHESLQKIKGVTPILGHRYEIGKDYITKAPEPNPVQKVFNYSHKGTDLQRAMVQMLERSNQKLPPPITAFTKIVGREPYPVVDKVTELVSRLLHLGVTRFQSLFRGSTSRSEVVATFIAVLELCKSKQVQLAGGVDDCIVTYNTQVPEDAKEGEVDMESWT